jgi:hypothetical protein
VHHSTRDFTPGKVIVTGQIKFAGNGARKTSRKLDSISTITVFVSARALAGASRKI